MPIYSNIYNLFHDTKSNIIRHFSDIFDFFYLRIYLIIVIGLNLLNWLLAYYIKISVTADLIILHYNIDFGVDLIGSASRLFIIPGVSLFILALDFVLLFTFLKNENFKFISHVLMISAILINVLLLLSLASLYFINFR